MTLTTFPFKMILVPQRELLRYFKTILAIFKNKHTPFKTFPNTFQTLKHFPKDKHLCIHSYERESLQRFPKQWPLLQNTFKTTPNTFSNNKSK